MGITNYFGFVLVALMLNLTPGSDTIYILTRSISEGRKAGYVSVLGITSGTIVHTVLASLGLSVILAQSATAFLIVKSLGGCYLLFLGVKALMTKSGMAEISKESAPPTNVNLRWVYRDGILTNVLNPKVAIFFLALLPQFVDPTQAFGVVPFFLLGLTFMTTGLTWCLLLAYFASRFSASLRKNPRIQQIMNRVSGLVFLGLGAKLLATER